MFDFLKKKKGPTTTNAGPTPTKQKSEKKSTLKAGKGITVQVPEPQVKQPTQDAANRTTIPPRPVQGLLSAQPYKKEMVTMYQFLISAQPNQQGQSQARTDTEVNPKIESMMFGEYRKKFPELTDIVLDSFCCVYPKDLELAGMSPVGRLTQAQCQDVEHVEDVAREYIEAYFKKNFDVDSKNYPIINLLSIPYAPQIVALVLTPAPPVLQNVFFEVWGMDPRIMMSAAKNLMNTSDAVLKVIEDWREKFRIPKHLEYFLSFKDVPLLKLNYDVLKKLPKELKESQIMSAVVNAIDPYLQKKGYSTSEIDAASIIIPDGGITDYYYVVIVRIDINEQLMLERIEKRKYDAAAPERHAAAVASGERTYFFLTVFGQSKLGISKEDMIKDGAGPNSRSVVARQLKIPLNRIVAVKHEEWKAPDFGGLSQAELEKGESSGAKRYKEKLKESLTPYLKEKGYSQEEINKNFKVYKYHGRDGMGTLFVIVEMNLK